MASVVRATFLFHVGFFCALALTFLPAAALLPTTPLKATRGRTLGPARTLRGGATMGLADYAGAASELFNNMRAPAALIGGSIVPMGFAAVPEIAEGDSALVKRLKQSHMVIAILSLSAEIIAVIYSTIAINKLSETVVAPAASVSELLKRDYELPWVGANVNFLAGMLGFASLLGLRAWLSFGSALGKVGMCAAGSVLCHAVSIVNAGIKAGDEFGDNRFGCNLFGLVKRYLVLQTQETIKTKGLLQVASIGLFAAAVYLFLFKTTPDSK